MSDRISTITLDEASIAARTMEAEHERKIAVTDLITSNKFALVGISEGPYAVHLRTEEQRLVFDITAEMTQQHHKIAVSVLPLKRLIRDYFMICESYYAAIKDTKPHKLETIDMARRGLHNEGSELLQELLKDKITVDFPTARRLFTLICVLHMKGL